MEVFLYAAKFDCYDKTDTLYFIIGTLEARRKSLISLERWVG